MSPTDAPEQPPATHTTRGCARTEACAGVRVGGFRVVDVATPRRRRPDRLGPVPPDPEGGERRRDRGGSERPTARARAAAPSASSTPTGPATGIDLRGQRPGPRRTPGPPAARRAPQLPGPGSPVRKPAFTGGGRRSAARPRARRRHRRPRRDRPGRGPCGGVGREAAVPVQVVSATLSTAPASGPQRRRPVQLEAGQSTASRSAGWASTSSTGSPMFPHSTAPAVGDEHRVQHRGGRGLAVGFR